MLYLSTTRLRNTPLLPSEIVPVKVWELLLFDLVMPVVSGNVSNGHGSHPLRPDTRGE